MNSEIRSHVHELVDQLPPVQLAAVETLLRSMLDPLARKLAAAEIDDEPFTAEDRKAVAEAEGGRGIPLEEVLGELGLSMADWDTMARTPLSEPLSLESPPGKLTNG